MIELSIPLISALTIDKGRTPIFMRGLEHQQSATLISIFIVPNAAMAIEP